MEGDRCSVMCAPLLPGRLLLPLLPLPKWCLQKVRTHSNAKLRVFRKVQIKHQEEADRGFLGRPSLQKDELCWPSSPSRQMQMLQHSDLRNRRCAGTATMTKGAGDRARHTTDLKAVLSI